MTRATTVDMHRALFRQGVTWASVCGSPMDDSECTVHTLQRAVTCDHMATMHALKVREHSARWARLHSHRHRGVEAKHEEVAALRTCLYTLHLHAQLCTR